MTLNGVTSKAAHRFLVLIAVGSTGDDDDDTDSDDACGID